MTTFRECGRCNELWPLDAVRCARCDCLLVMTVGDRVAAKAFGGLRPHEAATRASSSVSEEAR